METEIFRVDTYRIATIRKRILGRTLYVIAPVVAIVIMQFATTPRESWWAVIFAALFTTAVLGLSFVRGIKKALRSALSLEVVLSDRGVETKAEMAAYQLIPWDNAKVTEKPNGAIVVYDTTVSSYTRWMYGRGRIIIPPEMIEREKLLAELHKRCLGT